MKTQKARGVTAASPFCHRKSHFNLRGRKKKDRVVKGKLRIRSLPGVFLVVGVIVVAVGTALAVAGYWPYRISSSSLLGAAEGEISDSQSSGWSLGTKGLLSTASLVHSERMKLLGPVIMGVGLFILICANTVLYENRDRETQMLLAQMRSVICSVSAAVPSADLKEIATANSMAKHYQWVSSLPAAHVSILCLQQLASSEPLLQSTQPRDQEDSVTGIYQQPVLQTEDHHHQESEASPCFHSQSISRNSSKTDFNVQAGTAHKDKPNNCLVSANSISLGLDKVDILTAQPRRCHSMSYRTNPYIALTVLLLEEGLHKLGEEGQINQPVVTRREASSQVCMNIPRQFMGAVEQTHRSWPRLDQCSVRRYLRLENKEDSADKLLDQLEQQCTQWDKSFGSGPFQ